LIVMRAPPGLLQPADSIALEMLAVSTVRWRKAEAQVAKRGALQCDTDRRGKLQRVAPWAKVAATELRLVLDLSRSLGLTPLARSSVRVAPVAREARSEFERLLDAPVPGDFPRRNA
jgi:phage terminase small subunit